MQPLANHPKAAVIAWKKEQVRHDPRSGVSQAGAVELQNGYQQQRHRSPGHHLKSAGTHGYPRISHPLDGQPKDVDKEQGNVKRGIDPDISGSHRHDFRFLPCIHKQAQELVIREENKQKRENTVSRSQKRTGLQPFSVPTMIKFCIA